MKIKYYLASGLNRHYIINTMKIKCGEYDVHDSGVVSSFEQSPITFEFADDFFLKFSFRSDGLDSKPRFEYGTCTETTLEIDLINFDQSNGAGTTKPIRLGVLNKRELYTNFWVDVRSGTSNRQMTYTFYLKEMYANAK